MDLTLRCTINCWFINKWVLIRTWLNLVPVLNQLNQTKSNANSGHVQIMALKGRENSDLINLNKETEASCSNRSENSSEINLDISRTPPIESPITPEVHQGLPFFNPGSVRVGEFEQLLNQNTQRPSDLHLHCAKTEPGVQEGNFSSLLCSVEEQPPFWSWAEHHNFHWTCASWRCWTYGCLLLDRSIS